MYVLIGAAVLKFITGSLVEGAIVLLVVVLNAMIGYYQERKADDSLSNISKLLSSKATVESENGRLSIDAEDLIPGDRVYLAPGDVIPADLRMETVNELKIDESILTGEPDAVVKTSARLEGEWRLLNEPIWRIQVRKYSQELEKGSLLKLARTL